jgi:hypothetical protein
MNFISQIELIIEYIIGVCKIMALDWIISNILITGRFSYIPIEFPFQNSLFSLSSNTTTISNLGIINLFFVKMQLFHWITDINFIKLFQMLIDSVHFHVSAQSYLSSNGGTRGHHNICLIWRSKKSELLHAIQLYLIHHPYPIDMIFVNAIQRVLCE